MTRPSENGRNLLLVLGVFHAFNLIVMLLMFGVGVLLNNRPYSSTAAQTGVQVLFALPPILASLASGYIAGKYLWFRNAALVVLLLGVMEGVTYFNFHRGSSALPWAFAIRVAEGLIIAAGAPLAFLFQRTRVDSPSESLANSQP